MFKPCASILRLCVELSPFLAIEIQGHPRYAVPMGERYFPGKSELTADFPFNRPDNGIPGELSLNPLSSVPTESFGEFFIEQKPQYRVTDFLGIFTVNEKPRDAVNNCFPTPP